MATNQKSQEILVEGDLTMTNRMKKTTFVIGAVLIFALVFTMALTVTTAPTAYADDTIEIDTNQERSTYTQDGITVTVDDAGDEDGALIEPDCMMTITTTGNLVIKSIRFTVGYYWNWADSMTVSSGTRTQMQEPLIV